MFGRNPQRSQDMAPDGRLEIQDVFPTIQGEGPHTGRSAIFVRVAGCNLACWFCDTDFESAYTSELIPDPSVGVATLVKSIQEIAAERRHPPTLVVITGGEPCRQNIVPLIKALVAERFEVQIETTGAAEIIRRGYDPEKLRNWYPARDLWNIDYFHKLCDRPLEPFFKQTMGLFG